MVTNVVLVVVSLVPKFCTVAVNSRVPASATGAAAVVAVRPIALISTNVFTAKSLCRCTMVVVGEFVVVPLMMFEPNVVPGVLTGPVKSVVVDKEVLGVAPMFVGAVAVMTNGVA